MQESYCPTVISLFAGCGGSSLGYQMAGFKELLAIDFDKDAVDSFRANFDCPIWLKDIKRVTGQEILNFCNLKKGELDVLDGSPPCQGFSTAGKRIVNDSRNSLFKEFVRLIDGIQPKVFVMENVSGMIKGKMKGRFIEIMKSLKGLNYQVKCKLMNAKYYGVPQSRQRLIFIGVRNDLGKEPVFPEHSKKGMITFKKACFDLKGNKDGDRMLSDVVKKLAIEQPRQWSSNKILFKRVKGNLGSSINLMWADWDKVCGTLMRSEIALTGIVHPDRERYLSEAEIKRVGSFPDSFIFKNRRRCVEGVGNAVPPKMMEALALNIKKNILNS